MSDETHLVTDKAAEQPALKVGGLYKVTNPISEHFGKVGLLRSVVSYAEGLDIPSPKRPLWIEFIVWSGPHHCHTQVDFARDDVELYESEAQAQVSTADETPQGEIEQLLRLVNEVQTDQAEHAAHLDQLAHRADLQHTSWATDRMRLNALAQEVKELRDNAAADRLLIRNAEQTATGKLDALSEELWAQIERLDDRLDKLVDTKQPQKPAPSRLRRLKAWVATWAREMAFRLDGCVEDGSAEVVESAHDRDP